MLGGLLAAVLTSPGQHGDLDPRSYDSFGAHALSALLAQRGTQLTTVTGTTAALAQASAGSTLVVVHLERLTDAELASLTSTPANLFLVGADSLTLANLRVEAHAAGFADATTSVAPACNLPAATTAGSVRLDGPTYRPPSGGHACYPFGDGFGLVTYDAGGRQVTLLSSGTPLANGELGKDGDAALALGLLDATPRVVWLVPDLVPASAGDEHRSVTSLLPSRLKWATLQLAIAVVVVALWRGRRFGRLVAERVPVVVRQSESVFGRARLYRRTRARDVAAAALRAGAHDRMARRLGLSLVTSREGVVEAVARRSGRTTTDVDRLLYGSTPVDDQALVTLARELTTLEQEALRP